MQHHELLIDGASCGSCVKKIESAMQEVAGVEQAEMNFAQRTVLVSGTANSDALILAVEKAGYKAKLSLAENEEEALNCYRIVCLEIKNFILKLDQNLVEI